MSSCTIFFWHKNTYHTHWNNTVGVTKVNSSYCHHQSCICSSFDIYLSFNFCNSVYLPEKKKTYILTLRNNLVTILIFQRVTMTSQGLSLLISMLNLWLILVFREFEKVVIVNYMEDFFSHHQNLVCGMKVH